MKIYLAGPMTGLPEFNFPAFNHVAATLRARGFEVENMAEKEYNFRHSGEMSRADFLRLDFPYLVQCDTVVMLPGWTRSPGAVAEFNAAVALGFEVYFWHEPTQSMIRMDDVNVQVA